MARKSIASTALGGVLAAMLLAGCSDTGLPEQSDPPERPATQTWPDRDAGEIRTNAAAIDPCALLDPEVSAAAGNTAEPRRELFHCTDASDVRASVYRTLGQGSRFWQDRITIGGAVAYRSSPMLDWCSIELPIDFTRSIGFEQQPNADNDYDCSGPEAYAEVAAQKLLEDPRAFDRAAGESDGIVACDVLEQVVGEAPDGLTFEPRTASTEGLDGCGLWEAPNQGFRPVDPQASLRLIYRKPLEEFSSSGGWEDNEIRQVGDVETLVFQGGGPEEPCHLFFDARPSLQSEGEVIGAEVYAATCAEAESLIETLAPALADADPATADGAPLLYAAGEPDGPAQGVCADVVDAVGRGCLPANAAVEAPDDAAELIARGELEPDVLCAAAGDLVRERVDADLQAVTVKRSGEQLACEFVTTRHSTVVSIWSSAEPLGTAEVTHQVAGHQASADQPIDVSTIKDAEEASLIEEAQAAETYREVLVALGDPDEPGTLGIGVRVMPDRALGNFTGAEIDRQPYEDFDAIAAELVTALLGEGAES